MKQYSKIIPKWGKNIYNLWDCQALEYADPEIEKIAISFGSSKNISNKQFRKFNKIVCMDCKHYTTGQCPISNEEIKQNVKKYKSMKPKCSVCSMSLSFHTFLFHKNSLEQLCTMCLIAKNNGTLEEKRKKGKKSKKWRICEGIFLFFALILSNIKFLFDGVINGADYFFVGFYSLIIVGYLSYKIIKRRKKKKNEEGN